MLFIESSVKILGVTSLASSDAVCVRDPCIYDVELKVENSLTGLGIEIFGVDNLGRCGVE